MSWAFLQQFSRAKSDIDRLTEIMSPADRDNLQFVKASAKRLHWTENYVRAVYRDFLDWEEATLKALLSRGVLKGRNFLELAAQELGWTRAVAWNTYRRLKRKGGKREKQTEDIILEMLSLASEMSVRELAAKLGSANRWVYQVLTKKLVGKVTFRQVGPRRMYRLVDRDAEIHPDSEQIQL